MAENGNSETLRLTRDPDDHGPSLAERMGDRLDRLAFSLPFHKLRLKGRFPLKLLAVPDDPIAGDAERGLMAKMGRLSFAGHDEPLTDARLDDPAAPLAWRRWVHGWGWLRDLSAAEPLSKIEAGRVTALTQRWLRQFHDYDSEAWAPDLTARRLMMACCHASLSMPGSDHIHRSAVLNGIARWSRHLVCAIPGLTPGLCRLEAIVGLLAATLVLPGADSNRKRAEDLLDETLDDLLLPDDSAGSRCPLDLALIGDILLMAQAFHEARGVPAGHAVTVGLRRVRSGLSGLLMRDGQIASWQSGQPTAEQISRLLPDAEPTSPGRLSGYQRLAAGSLCLVMDAGPPPMVRMNDLAHASTLAVQISDGPHLLVVSCGGARGPDGPLDLPADLAMGLRSTAAHSTLVLADTNSSRVADSGSRRSAGVQEVVVESRSAAEGHWLEARHDGYRRRFGYDHLRRLWLSPDGTDLRGEDVLIPARRTSGRGQSLPVAIRFHLGPEAYAEQSGAEPRALIQLGSDECVWELRTSFNHGPGMLLVEPSLFLPPDGQPRQVQQILLSSEVAPGQQASIGWSLRRLASS